MKSWTKRGAIKRLQILNTIIARFASEISDHFEIRYDTKPQFRSIGRFRFQVLLRAVKKQLKSSDCQENCSKMNFDISLDQNCTWREMKRDGNRTDGRFQILNYLQIVYNLMKWQEVHNTDIYFKILFKIYRIFGIKWNIHSNLIFSSYNLFHVNSVFKFFHNFFLILFIVIEFSPQYIHSLNFPSHLHVSFIVFDCAVFYYILAKPFRL